MAENRSQDFASIFFLIFSVHAILSLSNAIDYSMSNAEAFGGSVVTEENTTTMTTTTTTTTTAAAAAAGTISMDLNPSSVPYLRYMRGKDGADEIMTALIWPEVLFPDPSRGTSKHSRTSSTKNAIYPLIEFALT